MASILIIDDDKTICAALANAMRRMGHDPIYRYTLEEGLQTATADPFDVVFLDVRLPDGNGLKALPKIREGPSSPEVIIITGEGDPDGAELAIKSGAWDYIEKPPTLDGLMLPLVRALQYRREKASQKTSVALSREGIVGSSPQITACLDLVAKAANSEANVLITGETGTGKELFASAIHKNSHRRDRKFIVVDCASLPETLAESILFGHEKGSFTGADRQREGLVKQADGGTLFLDEIAELPMSVQRVFLRVIQERKFRPVGSKHEIESDFRLVAATHRDLNDFARKNKFREDLLFRLLTINIVLPPLRERLDDIKELALHFMSKLQERYGKGIKGFSPEFIDDLKAYRWPGNVRELSHAMETILTQAGDEPVLFRKHLPTHIRVELARAAVGKTNRPAVPKPVTTIEPNTIGKWKDYRESVVNKAEEEYLIKLLATSKGNIKIACQISGLSRPRLYALMKKHGVTRPR